MVQILCNAFLNLQCKMCFKCAPKVIFFLQQHVPEEEKQEEKKIIQNQFSLKSNIKIG